MRKYRQFVYETGALDTGKGRPMNEKLTRKERKNNFELTRADMFRHRSRYFIDAGVIGGKSFVRDTFDRFKHLLGSKDGRRFTRLGGVDEVYSKEVGGCYDNRKLTKCDSAELIILLFLLSAN